MKITLCTMFYFSIGEVAGKSKEIIVGNLVLRMSLKQDIQEGYARF